MSGFPRRMLSVPHVPWKSTRGECHYLLMWCNRMRLQRLPLSLSLSLFCCSYVLANSKRVNGVRIEYARQKMGEVYICAYGNIILCHNYVPGSLFSLFFFFFFSLSLSLSLPLSLSLWRYLSLSLSLSSNLEARQLQQRQKPSPWRRCRPLRRPPPPPHPSPTSTPTSTTSSRGGVVKYRPQTEDTMSPRTLPPAPLVPQSFFNNTTNTNNTTTNTSSSSSSSLMSGRCMAVPQSPCRTGTDSGRSIRCWPWTASLISTSAPGLWSIIDIARRERDRKRRIMFQVVRQTQSSCRHVFIWHTFWFHPFIMYYRCTSSIL